MKYFVLIITLFFLSSCTKSERKDLMDGFNYWEVKKNSLWAASFTETFENYLIKDSLLEERKIREQIGWDEDGTIVIQSLYQQKNRAGIIKQVYLTTYPGKSKDNKYLSLFMLEMAVQSTQDETVYISTHDKRTFDIAKNACLDFIDFKLWEFTTSKAFSFTNVHGTRTIFSLKKKE